MAEPVEKPDVSVVILNYNGARWLARCLESLAGQTIFSRIEVIVADNRSSDGSDRLAAELLAGWSNGRFVQNGENLGYCEGNNRGAAVARGEYLLFLNNDTWLEPDCLEVLVAGVRSEGAAAATPLILNYDDDTFQSLGARGFDLFGLSSARRPHEGTREVLMPEGCAYLIAAGVFREVGGFDGAFFMYGDELDLSWRVWIAGYRAVAVPAARMHHRSAAQVNPAGGGRVVEHRTSDAKRYYSSRNSLLILLKNAQHVLLVLVLTQLVLTALESVVVALWIRRWSFVRRNLGDAVRDCWRMRGHVRRCRQEARRFRRRGDFYMLRFLDWRLNRWEEVRRVRRLGFPVVTAD